jgi:glutamate racemase
VVLERSRAITRYLRKHHHIKALVVACNTATAAAIATLRANHPGLPIVGIEPSIKPAFASSKTGNVAVMATRGTLSSQKFKALMAALPHTGHVVLQPCDGLADAIERNDATKIEALCAEYTRAIGEFGIKSGQIDTLVLGCTHYPFVQSVLRSFTGSAVVFLEGGVPVAKQTRKLLAASELLCSGTTPGDTAFLTTGSPVAMQQAIARWLGTSKPVQELTAHQTV